MPERLRKLVTSFKVLTCDSYQQCKGENASNETYTVTEYAYLAIVLHTVRYLSRK